MPDLTRTGTAGLSAEAVVAAYHRAWTHGDVGNALHYLGDDVRCFAPDDRVRTKTEWRDYLSGFVPNLVAAPEHARMVDGNRVALWYFPQTAITATALASELFTVAGAAIVEIRLAFDRLSYVPRPASA